MKENGLSQMLATPNLKDALRLFTLDNLWSCRSDPRFCYYVYIPKTVFDTDPVIEFRALVVVHGSTRVIEDARYDYREFAEKHNVAIVAPLFPCGMFDPDDINGYKAIREGSVRYDYIVLAMLAELHEKFPNINVDRFLMAGHSGGGQYAQRFFYLHPDRLEAVSISAPGRPTYLDFATDFFWGTRNFSEIYEKEISVEALRRVRVQLMVGENDTQSLGDSPYGTSRAQRMERLLENYKENGLNASLATLPGVGHFDGDKDRSHQNIVFFEQVIGGRK